MPATATLSQISDNFVYSAMSVYLLAMLAYAATSARRTADQGLRRGGELVAAGPPAAPGGVALPVSVEPGDHEDDNRGGRLGAIAAALTVLAFALHLLGVVTRGLAAGRAPWGNMYEFVLVVSLALTTAFLVFLRKEPIRALGVWITAIVLLALGVGVTVLYTPAGALVPVLNSYWLVIHVAAAMTAGGVFTLGAVITVLYLVKLRAERRHAGAAAGRYVGQLPSAATLNRIGHTAHLFAFPIWTFAVIAGAIWAENSWGRYWGWDPKETWAFVTWVFYAAYLHAEATAGWRGRKAAWFALLGFVAFVFNFFGVNMWITGLHSYAGV